VVSIAASPSRRITASAQRQFIRTRSGGIQLFLTIIDTHSANLLCQSAAPAARPKPQQKAPDRSGAAIVYHRHSGA
jgi:hypothetical protein